MRHRNPAAGRGGKEKDPVKEFRKALTFSYDDGVRQDERLLALFNAYGMKATFNLNSALLGKEGALVRNGVEIRHDKVDPEKVRSLYRGHEIAGHTLTHPSLPLLPDEEVRRQVEEDRLALSDLAGYEVVGMAYPGGGQNHDDRVAGIVREKTGAQYARTILSSYSFAPETDLYKLRPTVYHLEFEKVESLIDAFLASEPETPQIFYIWGHSYEFDAWDFWERFEGWLKKLSGKDDIFYGTNREVLLSDAWHGKNGL
ncbi:MAG: polysaccharide deacetylase family protein [Clostridia bacterium]|nr:polysaccharide deacetylase family protein [Clostridia bacterium]